MLEKLGCRVDVAEDGTKAIEACSKSNYDLVFMDGEMPVMDGWEASRRIRTEDKEGTLVPIIAMTATDTPECRKISAEAGMSDFLSKPATKKQITEVLNKWVPQMFASV